MTRQLRRASRLVSDGPFRWLDAFRMASLRKRFLRFGPGATIAWPIDVLTEPGRIAIGANVRIGPHVRLEAVRTEHSAPPGQVEIGDGTTMEGYCSISAADSIVIGSNVLIGAFVTIRDHDHGFRRLDIHRGIQPLVGAPVHVGDFVWLGQNVVITKGVRIGAGAVVGANAVVTRDVEVGAVVGGVPARQIGWADRRPLESDDR